MKKSRAAMPQGTADNIIAAYSSVLGGIVLDPALAQIPLDDHGFHRGHAVFDTCHIENGQAFGLSMHLDRLMDSAGAAKILDAHADQGALREELRSVVLEVAAATRRRDGVFIRYWLTAGRGDFSISPKDCSPPNFYCVAQIDSHSATARRGRTAAVVPVPLKPPFLATMKSTNYLLNALVAMEAEALGADQGIQIGEDGFLAESSIATIAIVDAAGILRSPPADRILESTTWKRVEDLAAQVTSQATPRGPSLT